MMSYLDDLKSRNIVIPNITNKNSNSLKESYNQKHFPDFYQYVLENTPKDLIFKEKLYWIINNIHTIPVCKTCGKKVRFVSFGEGYKNFCSGSCAAKNEQVKQDVKNRNLKKYGVDNPGKLKSSIEKSKQTKLERYGNPFYFDREKQKQTKLERYGNENYVNTEKRKQTCLERYGVNNGFASESIKNKIKQTNLKKYGCENPMSNAEIKHKTVNTQKERYGGCFNPEKSKQTKLERYGNEFYTNPEKSKQTKLEKYGNEFYTNPEKIRENFKEAMIRRNPDIIGYTQTGYRIMKCPHPECNKCQEKQFIIPGALYYNRYVNNTETCTILLPVNDYRSKNTSIEIFIKQLLDRYNIQYKSNVRNIISPKEIDIYIPEKNIAIECNGIYWHCDINTEKEYHYNKFIKCREKGIQLISIWEDQIINNPEKVELIILSKLGIYKERIYARKCVIKEVPSKECNNFIEKYHLQGKTNSSIRLGLYYNNELISVMTFGKGRKCLNSKTGYELYRYCCKEGFQVIGGASKLFKHFLKKYKPETIESFSSNDISNGNLYEQLGFTKVSDSIGYWYIDNEMKRHHRYKFTKYSLVKEGFDSSKTEFEIMNERGFYRIYDSGQTKWRYENRRS